MKIVLSLLFPLILTGCSAGSAKMAGMSGNFDVDTPGFIYYESQKDNLQFFNFENLGEKKSLTVRYIIYGFKKDGEIKPNVQLVSTDSTESHEVGIGVQRSDSVKVIYFEKEKSGQEWMTRQVKVLHEAAEVPVRAIVKLDHTTRGLVKLSVVLDGNHIIESTIDINSEFDLNKFQVRMVGSVGKFRADYE